MTMRREQRAAVDADLHTGVLPKEAVDEWLATNPPQTSDLAGDREHFRPFWQRADQLIHMLPGKPARNAAQQRAVQAVRDVACEARERFLTAHADGVYSSLTRRLSRFVRVEDLILAAADTFPGLVPTRAQLAAEIDTPQKDKDGLEIEQGIFISHMLAQERAGRHLCHAMLLQHPRTKEALARFEKNGALDLDTVRLERRGRAVHVTMSNPRYLNAEDQSTIDAMEIGADVAILDRNSDIAVLRGGAVDHPKYSGRRVFGSGINLTHLYRGKIPFVWFLQRELGFMHKFVRGVARPSVLPDDVHGVGTEKPWVAAVESFAIGGHCQTLLTMDFVLAANDAFMTLPARKEGIVPGAANFRLPRFTGDRIARQAIQYERKLSCDSPDGRLICDEVVPAETMDAAIEEVAGRLASSGLVGAVGNRRAFRVAQEPIDLFRRYCAVYAREQAYCHFSPALIENLERFWDAQNRAE
jgi:(3,5-dihydroxyphenyl)acetyl-CoA 1,2-dioxygenase